MIQTSRRALPLVLALVILVPAVFGQAATPPSGAPAANAPTARTPARMDGPQVNALVGVPFIEKELGLTAAQKEKLQGIANRYQAQAQQVFAAIRDLPQEQQEQKMQQVRATMASQGLAMRKEIEAVLVPEQLQRLQEMEFRTRAAMALNNPQAVEKLGLTEQQQMQLQRLGQEFQEQLFKLQHENIQKALKVLTPEQVQMLKQESANLQF